MNKHILLLVKFWVRIMLHMSNWVYLCFAPLAEKYLKSIQCWSFFLMNYGLNSSWKTIFIVFIYLIYFSLFSSYFEIAIDSSCTEQNIKLFILMDFFKALVFETWFGIVCSRKAFQIRKLYWQDATLTVHWCDLVLKQHLCSVLWAGEGHF